jgi:signal transduction histidine kinase
MRALVDAGIALTSELSLESVLQKLAAAAAELTGARYAALGVIDPSGTHLERFVTHGLSQEEHRAIGELPRGRGILGALIHDAVPLRLERIADDARSVGFPPNHPVMETFLGVPILLRGIAYGNLYLTEKEGGPFTQEDQELVGLLASQAAVAIENARLYESATRWSRQLESLDTVASALVSAREVAELLRLIARTLRELIDARLVTVSLPTPDGGMVIVAADGDNADDALAAPIIARRSKTRSVLDRRRSERVDSVLGDPEVDQDSARRLHVTSGIWVPLLVGGGERAIGVIACHDRVGPDPRFDNEDLRLAEALATRAAVAVELSERVQRDTVRRVVAGQELERRRLARELHDETGQALTSILLGLKAVEDARGDDDRRLASADLRELVVATLQDVRRLAVELRPKALDDFGLLPAVERLADVFAEQMEVEVDVEGQLGPERLPAEIETALYRIVQEALTNVVKHARASRVSILLMRKERSAVAVIEDNGVGFSTDGDAAGSDGLGLIGMRERVGLLDGRLQVESSALGGTTIVAEVPLP